MKHFTLFLLTSIIALASFVNAQPAKKSTKKVAKATPTKVVDSGQTIENGVGYLNKPKSFFEAIPGANDQIRIGYYFPVDGGKIEAAVHTSYATGLADEVIFVKKGAEFTEDEFEFILEDNLPTDDLTKLKKETVAPVKSNAFSYGKLEAHTIRDPKTREDYYIERGFQYGEGLDSYVLITTDDKRRDAVRRAVQRMRDNEKFNKDVEKVRYNLKVLSEALK